MFFKLKYVACCLVLFGTGMAYANVVVTVTYLGDVYINGSPDNDELHIEQVPAGELYITGKNGTRIDVMYMNGMNYGAEGNPLLLLGTSRGSIIRCSLGDGDDVAQLEADVKYVSCYLGDGNDRFNATQMEVERDLAVYAGTGSDHIFMENVMVGRNLRLDLDAGVDGVNESTHLRSCNVLGSFTLNQTSGSSRNIFSDLFVDSSLQATLGTGLDSIVGHDVRVSSSTSVDLGSYVTYDTDGRQNVHFSGSHLWGDVTFNGGNGRDEFKLRDSWVPSDVVINTYAGDDIVELIDTIFFGNITLDTGSGDDYASFSDRYASFPASTADFISHSANVSVNMGAGNDELHLARWEARRFTAFLGSGNDVVSAGYSWTDVAQVSTEVGDPYINGGAGLDWMNASNRDDFFLLGFEDEFLHSGPYGIDDDFGLGNDLNGLNFGL